MLQMWVFTQCSNYVGGNEKTAGALMSLINGLIGAGNY